jgi:hypoxanthine phosphoribosyltransferase
MDDMKKKVLIDEEAIAARVKELARDISAQYSEGNLLIIGILKGSFVFIADLVRSLSIPCEVDFAKISSYGAGTVSSGTLQILLEPQATIQGRDVLLVDDIVDSGLTLSEYRKHLETKGPRTLRTAAMIDKTGRREKYVELDYCGFSIESGFLVGYGLDCNECFRNLGSIYVIEEE